MLFQSRAQAGAKLAQELLALDLRDPFVLAIPRGGLPVGGSVSRTLGCPLDVIPLVKIPIPWSPDANYGTAAPDGSMALNTPLINRLELSRPEIGSPPGRQCTRRSAGSCCTARRRFSLP